jgi:hypothetical protein
LRTQSLKAPYSVFKEQIRQLYYIRRFYLVKVATTAKTI